MSPSEKPLLLTEIVALDAGDVAVLTLDRPEQRNPLDWGTVRELRAALSAVTAAGARAVIVTGNGPAFSAGGDLKGYLDLYERPGDFAAFLDDLAGVCDTLERGPLPSIAMVNGTCVAGGLELALSCDLVVLADDARVGDGHLRFGQLPGAGGSQRLVRAIGPQRAREWLLTGELHTAQVAYAAGLAAAVVPGAELRARTLALAQLVCRHSPLALRRAKELIALAFDTPLDEGLRRERALVHEYATTSFDATEGLRAFDERREPRFEGR